MAIDLGTIHPDLVDAEWRGRVALAESVVYAYAWEHPDNWEHEGGTEQFRFCLNDAVYEITIIARTTEEARAMGIPWVPFIQSIQVTYPLEGCL